MTTKARLRFFILFAAAIAAALVVATQLLRNWGTIDTAPLLREARTALAQSDFQRAGPLLDLILEQDPQHQQALLERGKLWSVIGKHQEALNDWQSVRAVESKGSSRHLASEARFLEGQLLIDMHRAREAEQRLLEASDLSNQNTRALELLLRVYVLQMRCEDTQRMLNLIEQRRQLSLEEMVLRVDAGGPIIDAAQAIEQLRMLVRADPADTHSIIALLRYYLTSEQLADAEILVGTLSMTAQANSDVSGLHALCALKRSAGNQAREFLQRGQNSRPLGYWWWMGMGGLAEFESRPCIACECYQQAVVLNPRSGVARYRYGLVMEACGNTNAAAEQLAIASKIDRLHQHTSVITRMVGMAPADLTRALLEIATLERELNHPAEAARWARLAIEIEPANAEALALIHSSLDNSNVVASPAPASNTPIPIAIAGWLAGKSSVPANDSSPPPSENVAAAPAAVQFEDVHEAALLDFQYFNGNSGFKYLIEAMGGGVSILDFDADGWPDCYFPQGSQLPSDPQDLSHLDQIYRNLDGARFLNVTRQTRIVENRYSQGTAAADVNNDGFADVIVANFGRSSLFINQGDGTFIDASEAWGIKRSEMSSSVALADLDNDGNLDLYLVNYVDGIRVCRDSQGRISTCNPQNFSGVQDRVYRNSGESSFIDVTQQSGVSAPDGKGLGIVVCDLDDDGLSDIYVANDTTPNLLFKNLGGMRFRNVSLESGTALSPEGQAQAGMGIAAADLNGDLRTDLFVTNFHDEPNNVYINHGELLFSDEAIPARIVPASKPMLGFGAQAEDFDLDGKWDLIVANGHIDDFSYRGEPWKMPAQLFRNLGQGTFDECGTRSGPYFRGQFLGRGIASFDWNRDGRKDFIVVHQDRPVALLENRTESTNRSLTIELIGTRTNRDAIGAYVIVDTGSSRVRRDVTAGDGFYSTNQRHLCIGLGNTENPTSVTVTWPSGGEQRINSKKFGKLLQVLQQSN